MKKYVTVILSVLFCMLAALAGCGEPPQNNAAVPDGISVSGMKTAFVYGERFSSAGLKVTVSLSDGTKGTAVSGEYTVDSSAYDATAEGDYSIVVTYKERELKTSYTVTVSKTQASGGESEDKDEEDQKKIDLWIIAGQSNAAGYSNLTQAVAGESYSYRELLAGLDARNASGYNVKYYGTTDVDYLSSMPEITMQNKVGMGLGRTADFIGPELGMANVLAERTSKAETGILKFACGGSFLCDIGCEAEYPTQKQYGNWTSPSIRAMAKENGLTIHANNGLCYDRLLEVIEQGVRLLLADGYSVSVKGYIWMQGEADAGNAPGTDPAVWANRYEAYLKLFIGDLRAAVAEITQDEQAKTRPFVIGKINPSGDYGNFEEKVRTAEDRVAASLANVYTVESSDLLIKDGGTVLGSDAWHFNARDMFTLGQRFAAKALEALAL